jgi:siroheme synthase (precorrin-2 oxidase/ferrochelatase)
MLQIDEAKTELNRRVKESLRKDLRAKSWEEKVASIARMNVADKIAKEAMRKALATNLATRADRAEKG